MNETALQDALRSAQLELNDGSGTGWQDSKRAEFNQRYWLPIEEASGQYLASLGALDSVAQSLKHFLSTLDIRL